MNIAIDTFEVRKELKDLRRELKKKLHFLLLLQTTQFETIGDVVGAILTKYFVEIVLQ